MKLISCHIEQFGKWSDRNFTFTDGCNVLCEENGWGKSMLAAFIRTMFYGFAGGKIRDDLHNERKRYQPWQGGVCGGSLKFESNGKVYELTRIFGVKEKDDKFELRDAVTNLKSDDYAENIGEELFGIDRTSFCRTVFITQNDCQTEATDGVNAKLGNLSGEKDDLMNFETVNQRLTDLINGLSPTRKTGELAKKKAEIATLKDQVSYGPATDRDIHAEQEQKAVLLGEQEELKETRSRLIRRQQELFVCKERLIRQRQYEGLCKEVLDREEDLKRCREKFPGELPERAELERYIKECESLIAEKKAVEMFEMTGEDMEQYRADKALFAPGRPSDEALAEKHEQADLYRQLHWERASGCPTQEEEQKLAQYKELFGPEVPDRSELRAVEEDWRLRASEMSVLITKNDYLHRMEAQVKARAQEALQRRQKEKKKGIIRALVCEAVAVICLIIGIVLLAGGGTGVNWIAIGLFATAVIIAALGVLGLRQMMTMKVEVDPTEEDEEILALRREIEVTERTAAEVEKNTEEYLRRWNREYREDMVLAELARLSDEAQEYGKLREKIDHYQDSRIDERIDELQGKLETFVKIYHPEAEIIAENGDEWLEKLKRERDRYNDLRERKLRAEEAEKKYKAHQSRISAYIGLLGFKVQEDMPRQLQTIQTDLQQYGLRVGELEKAVTKRKEFEAANDLALLLRPIDSELLGTEEALASQLDDAELRLENLQKLIRQKEDLLDELREKRDGISVAEELLAVRQEEYRERESYYRALKRTKELLEKAKTSFTAKYTGPILAGFGKYYRLLTGKEPSGHYLDANLKLTVSEQGLQRETKFFSEGWKDLLGICMRMAMVDAMYREEKPVVIFDDPFVNLDRDKTEAALRFLEEIGKEYQVIYFTCHESRAGKR